MNQNEMMVNCLLQQIQQKAIALEDHCETMEAMGVRISIAVTINDEHRRLEGAVQACKELKPFQTKQPSWPDGFGRSRVEEKPYGQTWNAPNQALPQYKVLPGS